MLLFHSVLRLNVFYYIFYNLLRFFFLKLPMTLNQILSSRNSWIPVLPAIRFPCRQLETDRFFLPRYIYCIHIFQHYRYYVYHIWAIGTQAGRLFTWWIRILNQQQNKIFLILNFCLFFLLVWDGMNKYIFIYNFILNFQKLGQILVQQLFCSKTIYRIRPDPHSQPFIIWSETTENPRLRTSFYVLLKNRPLVGKFGPISHRFSLNICTTHLTL